MLEAVRNSLHGFVTMTNKRESVGTLLPAAKGARPAHAPLLVTLRILQNEEPVVCNLRSREPTQALMDARGRFSAGDLQLPAATGGEAS